MKTLILYIILTILSLITFNLYADMPCIQGIIEFSEKAERDTAYNYLVGKNTTTLANYNGKEVYKNGDKILYFTLRYPPSKLGDRNEITNVMKTYSANAKIINMKIWTHICRHDTDSQCKITEVVIKGNPDSIIDRIK